MPHVLHLVAGAGFDASAVAPPLSPSSPGVAAEVENGRLHGVRLLPSVERWPSATRGDKTTDLGVACNACIVTTMRQSPEGTSSAQAAMQPGIAIPIKAPIFVEIRRCDEDYLR